MYKTKISDPEQKCKTAKKRYNILIVDDDEDSRQSLADLIKARGHNVTTIDEGMKCVNRCSENKFDIIFMDYHINDLDGELDGNDVIRMVRDFFDIDSVIYAYTGDNTKKAIESFKKNNLKGALIKPVETTLIKDLFTIIETDPNDISSLSKIAIKNKNFLYFQKKDKPKSKIITHEPSEK